MKLRLLTENLLLHKLTPEAIEANDIQPEREWIENELDKRAERAKLPPKQKIALSPSELSLKGCDLEVWFRFYQAQYPWIDPQPIEVRRKWDEAAVLGDWVHSRWQDALAQSGIVSLESIEGRVYDRSTKAKKAEIDARALTQNSRIDFEEDSETCGEIKSVASKYFKPDPANDSFVDKLKIDQAYLYQHLLGYKQTHYITVKREAKSYFTKAAVAELVLEHDPVHTIQLLNKATYIMDCVYEGKGPEVTEPPNGSSYYCQQLCGFAVHCPVGKRFI